MSHKPTRPTDTEILTLYASNTAKEIAAILGRPHNTVRMWIQEARTGVRHCEYRRPDRAKRTRRFSAEDIASVMTMRAQGIKWRCIAEVFSAPPSSIRWAVGNAKDRGMAAYPSESAR